MADKPDVEALAALYAAERADITSTASYGASLLALGLTYFLASLTLLSGDIAKNGGPWVLVLSPLPLFLLVLHVLLLAGAAGARGRSALLLETQLVQLLGRPMSDHRPAIGLRATMLFVDLSAAKMPVRFGITAIWSGLFLIVFGHAFVMINRAADLPGDGSVQVWAAAPIYGVLLLLVSVTNFSVTQSWIRQARAQEARTKGRKP